MSQIYSWNETLHVSDNCSVHHQEFFTVHTATEYVIQFCRQLAGRIRMDPHLKTIKVEWLFFFLYVIKPMRCTNFSTFLFCDYVW